LGTDSDCRPIIRTTGVNHEINLVGGDNVGACKKFHGTAYDCFREKGDKYGISSTSDSSSDPAYITNVGWDFPSGIGSVNAFNLVMEWPGG
jgi:hypothetical protein